MNNKKGQISKSALTIKVFMDKTYMQINVFWIL